MVLSCDEEKEGLVDNSVMLVENIGEGGINDDAVWCVANERG